MTMVCTALHPLVVRYQAVRPASDTNASAILELCKQYCHVVIDSVKTVTIS